MSIEVLPWQRIHFEGCMAAFDSNLPDFFAAPEREEFYEFMEKLVNSNFDSNSLQYWTVVKDNNVVGCGGVWINTKESNRPATLIWGLIHRQFHGHGFGSRLLMDRLAWLKGKCTTVLLDTTPNSFLFYEKHGFVKTGFKKDGYEPGLDMVLAKFVLDKPNLPPE